VFTAAQFSHDPNLEDARARLDVPETVQRFWPDGWVLQPPNPEDGQLPEQVGTWGFLVRATAEGDQTQ
jgi:hypothetical protein